MIDNPSAMAMRMYSMLKRKFSRLELDAYCEAHFPVEFAGLSLRQAQIDEMQAQLRQAQEYLRYRAQQELEVQERIPLRKPSRK